MANRWEAMVLPSNVGTRPAQATAAHRAPPWFLKRMKTAHKMERLAAGRVAGEHRSKELYLHTEGFGSAIGRRSPSRSPPGRLPQRRAADRGTDPGRGVLPQIRPPCQDGNAVDEAVNAIMAGRDIVDALEESAPNLHNHNHKHAELTQQSARSIRVHTSFEDKAQASEGDERAARYRMPREPPKEKDLDRDIRLSEEELAQYMTKLNPLGTTDAAAIDTAFSMGTMRYPPPNPAAPVAVEQPQHAAPSRKTMRTKSRGRPLLKKFGPAGASPGGGGVPKSQMSTPPGDPDPVGVQLFKQYCMKHYDTTPHFLKRNSEPTE